MNGPAPFHIVDWFVLVFYFGLTLGIGAYFYRKTRSTEGFTAANRSLPGWVCGLSIFATFLSSISYLANPGKTFASNWSPFVFSLSIPIVLVIAVKWFLPLYRNSNEVSAYAHLEKRFGLWARLYTVVFYLLTQIARVGVVLYLLALPMQVIFGWDILTILILTGLAVTAYTFIGGIMAVIWNDAIQAIVLMIGAVICLIVMLAGLPEGPSQVFEVAAEQGKFSLGDFGLSLKEPTFWVVMIYGIVMNVQNFGIDQSYVQRYIASSSDKEARRSLWLGGLLYVPVSALFFFIGTTLFVYYEADATGPTETALAVDEAPSDLQEVRMIVASQRLIQEGVARDDAEFAARQSAIAADLSNTEIGDRVFPHFIAKHLPPGLTGLLIAAVFAAAMSTVSTSLNSSATLIMTDFYKRLINPAATEQQSMRVLYGATVVIGVLGTALAMALVPLTNSVLDIWWTLSGIFAGGTVGIFLLGLISRKARNPAAITATILGLIGMAYFLAPKIADTMLTYLTEGSGAYDFVKGLGETLGQSGWMLIIHANLVPVVGALVILLVGIGWTQLTSKTNNA